MARENRHYIRGRTSHLPHRCHKKEFLLLGIISYEQFKQRHRSWVEEPLASRNYIRQNQWTDSIAVEGKDLFKNAK